MNIQHMQPGVDICHIGIVAGHIHILRKAAGVIIHDAEWRVRIADIDYFQASSPISQVSVVTNHTYRLGKAVEVRMVHPGAFQTQLDGRTNDGELIGSAHGHGVGVAHRNGVEAGGAFLEI